VLWSIDGRRTKALHLRGPDLIRGDQIGVEAPRRQKSEKLGPPGTHSRWTQWPRRALQRIHHLDGVNDPLQHPLSIRSGRLDREGRSPKPDSQGLWQREGEVECPWESPASRKSKAILSPTKAAARERPLIRNAEASEASRQEATQSKNTDQRLRPAREKVNASIGTPRQIYGLPRIQFPGLALKLRE